MPVRCGLRSGRPRRRRRRAPGAAGLLVALALLTSTPAVGHDAKPSGSPATSGISATPRLPRIKPAPDFDLHDAVGRPVRLSALHGRVVLISFIYTHCTAACPLLTRQMALLQERLAAARPRVHFLSVTVDPERDGPEALPRYARVMGAPTQGWQFLRDTPARLGAMLAAYDEWTRVLSGGEIDHPARLYLIDPRGDIREIYSLAFFDERQALIDIRALLQEAGPRP